MFYMNKYYVVSSDILPEVLDKVMEAQTLLQSGQARRISEAVKRVGISRGTFYKYKDAVFAFNQDSSKRKAIFTIILKNEPGSLSSVLSILSAQKVNIVALNQSIPINGIASVTLTIDITEIVVSMDDLQRLIETLDVVEKVELVAVE